MFKQALMSPLTNPLMIIYKATFQEFIFSFVHSALITVENLDKFECQAQFTRAAVKGGNFIWGYLDLFQFFFLF